MEEENNWQVSDQNKKGGKRFLRQLIVFVISLLIVVIVGATIYLLYTNRPEKPENNTPNVIDESDDEEEDIDLEDNDETTSKSSGISKVEEKRYSIVDKDFYFDGEDEDENYGIKLYEYDNTNKDYAEIYLRLDSYYTEPSYSYVVEAKSNGQNLLLNDRGNSVSEREIMGGIVSSIKLDKSNIGDEIEIKIKEMNEHSSRSRTVERKGSTTLVLKRDLEKLDVVKLEKNTSSYTLENMKFETYKDDDVNKETFSTASANCLRSIYSIGISTQYGNRMVTEENIQFYSVDNVNNLNLDDAFDIETKIEEKVGHYGILDMYKVFVSNGSGEITAEYEITFEDMKNLIDGKEANAKGKKITAQDILSNNESMTVANSSKITLPNKIRAYEYTYRQDPSRTHYMFILNNHIYYIDVPNGERYKDNVDLFLNSLTEK